MSATINNPLLFSRLPARRAIISPRREWPYYHLILSAVRLIVVVAAPFWLSAMFFSCPRDYPFYSSMFIVPALAIFCYLMFSLKWRSDKFLKLAFGTGILLRLASAGSQIWLGYYSFSGSDSFHYWTMGNSAAAKFDFIGWSAFHAPWWGTNLIYNICGIITLAWGNALPALCVLFALAALWGSYFFYRAFCIAFPEGDLHLYLFLVTALPSILFWPSTIGKDALAQLFIGTAVLGYAKFLKSQTMKPLLITILGIVGTLGCRPHVAAMLAMGFSLPYALGKTRKTFIRSAGKLLLVPVFIFGSYFIASSARDYVRLESTDVRTTAAAMDKLTKTTQIGGSAFNEGSSLPVRVAQAPFLLFRPFPWEAHNATSAIAAVESMGLLLFCWYRRREFRKMLRHWREPFVGFILIYTIEFSVAFAAATSNFGIIARQRIMMMPLIIMLFCAKRQANAQKMVWENHGLRRRRSPQPLGGMSPAES